MLSNSFLWFRRGARVVGATDAARRWPRSVVDIGVRPVEFGDRGVTIVDVEEDDALHMD